MSVSDLVLKCVCKYTDFSSTTDRDIICRVCMCAFVSIRMRYLPPLTRHRRSSYKDCNTLHLPMERFSPVRRFSDGAATIQAFKAHLENSSLIKKLKQVCDFFHFD